MRRRPGVRFTHSWRLLAVVVAFYLVASLLYVGAVTIWGWLT